MPELRHLRAFVAVAEELNFTRAAERLHLAQQAVSKSVAQLEAELGVGLLERTTHDVRLTAAGSALLDSGRAAIAAADAAFDEARRLGRGLAGTVRIGVSPAVGQSTRYEVAAVLRAESPELRVSFHEVRPREIDQALRDRSVDVVLARTVLTSPGVQTAALTPTDAAVLLPADHRLAGRGSIRLAELDGERLLTWSAPGTPYTDMLVDRLAAAGASVELVEAAVTGSGAPPELAATGAVAIAPTGWPRDPGIVELPVDDDLTLPLLVAWPTGRPGPVVDRLLAEMSAP